MLSVLFCSRVQGNPDSDLPRLLDSAAAHVAPRERNEIEFLIKFDDDDAGRPSDGFFARYPRSRCVPSSGRAARAGTPSTTPRSTCSPSATRAPASA